MLNEGIHVDGISGVILFRPTVSPIVYKQQIGRALSVGKDKNAVILDVVNNFQNLYSIGAIEEEMQVAVNYYQLLGDTKEIVNARFRILDETQDAKRLFDELNDTLSASWDLMFNYARQYYETHGDLLPVQTYKTPEGYSLGQWLNTQRMARKGVVYSRLTLERIEKLDSIGMVWDRRNDYEWDRRYKALLKYHVSACVHEIMPKESYVDIIARHEYDYTLPEIAAEKSLEQIAGISFVKDGQVVDNPDREFIHGNVG